jgi:hypothetical protein
MRVRVRGTRPGRPAFVDSYEKRSGEKNAVRNSAMVWRDASRSGAEKNRYLEAALCLAAGFFGFFPGF